MANLIEIRDMCKIYNPGENEVRALNQMFRPPAPTVYTVRTLRR